jgi:hypothetical protein
MPSLEKWKRAVVHLECAADSDMDRGMFRDIRSRGTALFIESSDQYFLVTARHVVLNKLSDTIYNMIFRVFSLEELASGGSPGPDPNRGRFLMNLGAGGSVFYSFSEPDNDLGVISLNHLLYIEFRNDLLASGYRPVSIDDVDEGPSKEGAEVFSVGYPGSMATVATWAESLPMWASAAISQPCFSFGRVAMSHPLLDYFLIDQSIYPGNSGGPVVEEDRLIGIVSGQPTMRLEYESDTSIPARPTLEARVRIPFGNIIKAKHIRPLIDKQINKDKHFPSIASWRTVRILLRGYLLSRTNECLPMLNGSKSGKGLAFRAIGRTGHGEAKQI